MDTEWPNLKLLRREEGEIILRKDDFAVLREKSAIYLPKDIRDFIKYFGWGCRFCSELRFFPKYLYSGPFEAAIADALSYNQLSVDKLIDFSKRDPWIFNKYRGKEVNFKNLFCIASTSYGDDFFLNILEDGDYNILWVEDDGYVYDMGSLTEFMRDYLGNKHGKIRRGEGENWSYELGIPVSIREADCQDRSDGPEKAAGDRPPVVSEPPPPKP